MDQAELAKIRERVKQHRLNRTLEQKKLARERAEKAYDEYNRRLLSYIPSESRPHKRPLVFMTEAHLRPIVDEILHLLNNDPERYKFPFFEPCLREKPGSWAYWVVCSLPSWNDVYQSS